MGTNFWPLLRSFLGDWTSDCAAFGLSFVVDNDSGVVFAIHKGAVGAAPRSALANNDYWVDFLAELLNTLFN